ncbi:hypothetical protein Purlil1_12804 [Purpureocillium lilacinum]|uniref:Uncharacterized protein n=1 Tax=Purpureocillium lilacinum TaxID=33203 RepID=A0ABR0BFV8_PURLI|nr:hypothetical protein Purlil1_12804 [Purpureocillium lilacinum]
MRRLRTPSPDRGRARPRSELPAWYYRVYARPFPVSGIQALPVLAASVSNVRLYKARDHEGKARSTLGFASQNSLAPRPTPLPRSGPQEPGDRNGPGVAGGKNLPKGSEADERLAFKEKNRPQLAAGNRTRLGSEGTCGQAEPRLRAIEDELS